MTSSTADATPIRTAVVGMGGYAGRIIDLLLRAEGLDDHPPRLVAVTSSNPARHPERALDLEGRGVEICSSLDDLLGRDDVEAVWLPVPIELHRPFLERSLAAGKAVLCEKPVAGTVEDCDAMIAARDRHGPVVGIGYQSIADPATLELKRRLVGGALGEIRSATVRGVWPRDSAYYGRAPWAGRLRHNGAWVLDSPVQNAMNHFLNLTLFFLGSRVDSSAVPVGIEAELYRANDIENYDTASLRIEVDSGASVLVLYTHAARETVHPVIHLVGDHGSATWRFDGHITLTDRTGAEETIPVLEVQEQRLMMASAFNRLARGAPAQDRVVGTLEQARSTIVAVNGASEAAPVHTIPPPHLRVDDVGEGARLISVPGLEHAIVTCARRGLMLHESGTAEWTAPAQSMDLSGYERFAGPFVSGDG